MTKAALLKPRSQRIAFIELSPELILDLLRIPEDGTLIDEGWVTCPHDRIPDDAKALRASINEYGNITLMMESNEFGEIHEGMRAVKLCPMYSVETMDPKEVVNCQKTSQSS